MNEKEIKEAIEKEAELESHDQSVDLDDLDVPTKQVDRFEHTLIEDTVDVIKKGPSVKEQVSSEDKEEEVKYEEEEECTTEEVIEEIFQVSEDGDTWKTVKKITTITPSGTTEKIIELGGIAKDVL